MEVQLTADQKAFVQKAIQSGRFSRPEAAVEEALSQWEERERLRAELLVDIEEARASLAAGEGTLITNEDESRRFVENVRRRGLARFGSAVR